MPLLTINNPDEILAEAVDGPQRLPLVKLPGTDFECSLLKLDVHGCCEVLGYQLAPRLHVPVLPAVPVWCPRAFGRCGPKAGEGRMGLAVQYCQPFRHVAWEQATSQAPEAVAASLALSLIDRYEWGEFATTDLGLVFFDLERLFPNFRSERTEGETWDDVASGVSSAAEEYRGIACSFVDLVLVEATKLGLTDLLRLAVADAASIPAEEMVSLFDLEPHPLAKQIVRIAADIAVMQFADAARLLGV